MSWSGIQEFAEKKVLYLTTIGRKTGLPRRIQIWFIVHRKRFYLFAETDEAAAWVKNVRKSPGVTVRIRERQIGAAARILDRKADRKLWDKVAAIADRKYRWGDGLPVEAKPLPPQAAGSDLAIYSAEDC